jgi:hypothetical protein
MRYEFRVGSLRESTGETQQTTVFSDEVHIHALVSPGDSMATVFAAIREQVDVIDATGEIDNNDSFREALKDGLRDFKMRNESALVGIDTEHYANIYMWARDD